MGDISKSPEKPINKADAKKVCNNSYEDGTGMKDVLRLYSRMIVPLSKRCELIYLGDENLNTALRDDAICQFLTLVACGQEKQVEELLKAHPKLLLEVGLAKDYSGRRILGTAYQIALGAEDMDMCKMMDKYFALLKDGEAEKKKQFDTQFPDGLVENNPSNYNFAALVTAISIDNVANNEPNEATQAAIKKFQDDFRPKAEEVIKTGKHFNMQHLIKAYEIYVANYDDWNDEQSSLFWRQVIGHLQRQVPACYAQAYCQGLYNVVEEKKPLERKFDLDNGSVYFPLDRNDSSKLGRDYGVYSGVGAAGGGWRSNVVDTSYSHYIEKLYRAKTAQLGKLKTRLHSAGQQLEQNQDNQRQIVRRRSQGCVIS